MVTQGFFITGESGDKVTINFEPDAHLDNFTLETEIVNEDTDFVSFTMEELTKLKEKISDLLFEVGRDRDREKATAKQVDQKQANQ